MRPTRRSASSRGPRSTADPYAELKTRVHHACIAKLGPQLFTTETSENLSERVLREVTEQLTLDRTPLTREERRRIVREITDDILGYGPLEPLLRDDSVTEVMVNNFDRIFIEREGKLEQSDDDLRRQRPPAADHRQDRLAGRPPHRRVVADGRRASP